MASRALPPRYVLLAATTADGATVDFGESTYLFELFPIHERFAEVRVIDPAVPWTKKHRLADVMPKRASLKLSEVRYQIAWGGKLANFKHRFKRAPGVFLTGDGILSKGKLFASYRADEIFPSIKTRSPVKVIQFIN